MGLVNIFFNIVVLLLLSNASSSPQAQVRPFIVGGTPATQGFPYQVSVRKSSQHICGGSIISATAVLTAAHCTTTGDGPAMQILSASLYSIRAGSTNVNSGGVIVNAKQILVHPQYYFPACDVSIIKLKTALTPSSTISPIALASTALAPGSPVIASGWGFNATGGVLPTQLQQVTLTVITNTQCAQSYGTLPPSVTCVQAPVGQGICQGDSGGPMVNNGILYCVVSFSPQVCGSAYPDGAANVTYLRPWIVQNMV